MTKVIKRDGRIKLYDNTRVVNAVKKAFDDVYKDNDNTYISNKIGLDVLKSVNEIKEDTVSIEKIQDIVINKIKDEDESVANAYEDYREKRNEDRIKRSKKEKFYKDVLQCDNVDNDNANINQYSFSGRKYRIADYEQKMYALRNLISEEGREAFESGLIYYHDLNSYAIGEHNCSFPRISELLSEGFKTRNGDVRPANSFSTACQLVAVIFQVQSQVQFGGVASLGFDWELEPFVHKSFVKLFIEGLFEKYNINDFKKQTRLTDEDIHIDNEYIKKHYKEAYDYAVRHLEKEGKQSCQGLYHNLNTLESRAGSQVPFTSLNLGRNTSTYGRLITKWIFDASLSGIGKHNRTSIFPISVFQYKKGVNDKEGTPNYDLKLKAIESMTHRIYPNWGNGDWKQNIEDPDDYTTFFATMG